MLNDAKRNGTMEAAIKDAGISGKTVFEIGTGAGLTALMLARNGALHVTTCEINAQLFDIAKAVIEKSEFRDRITLINKSSTDAIDDGDVPLAPDFIFTETIDCGVVDEGFYAISKDIGRIAGRGTQILPQNIQQFGFLIDSESLYIKNSVDIISGIDISVLNQYRTAHYFPVNAGLHSFRILSATTHLRQYVYQFSHPISTRTMFYSHSDGWCHGMLSYFYAHFGHYIITNELGSSSHWHQAYHPLEKPFRLRSGSIYHATFSSHGQLTLEEASS